MKKLRFGLLPIALLSAIGGRALAQDTPPTAADASSPAPTAAAPDAATPAADSTAPAPDASASTTAPAASSVTSTDDIFDNRFYIAPLGAYALSPDGRHSDNAYGGALALGKSIVPHLSLEVLGTYLHYKGKSFTETNDTLGNLCKVRLVGGLCPTTTVSVKSQDIYGGGLGANVYLSPSNYGLFVHGDAQGGNRFVYNGGLGLDLPFASHSIALRIEALYHKENGYKGEPLFELGIRIPLGSLPAPAAPPEPPVAVVPPVEAPPPPPPPPPCQTPAPGEPITMEGCKAGDTIILRGVNFDFNKATLTLNAKTILDQVATALTSRSDIKVELDGHTDGKGSGPYNLKLSDRRAKSVKQYLVGKGIDTGRMTTKGFGKTMPIADNATQEGRDLNRRVELKVTESNGAVGDSLSTAVPVSSGASDSSSTPPAPPADTSAPAPDASTPPQ